MKPGENRVIISGPVGWSKLYDFNGKAYTTLTLMVKVDTNLSVFVDINVNNKDMERADLKALINTITSQKGIVVLLYASIVERIREGKPSTISVKGNLSGLGIIDNYNNSVTNTVCISGYVESNNNGIVTVKIPYVNPLSEDKKTKYRIIPIESESNVDKGDIACVFGSLKVNSKQEDGKKVDQLAILANKILSIKSLDRHNSPRSNANGSGTTQYRSNTEIF